MLRFLSPRTAVVALGAAGVLALASLGGPLPRAGAEPVVSGLKFHTLGLFDPAAGIWYLRNSVGRTTQVDFGREGDIPLMGDWDGDGIDTPAVYRPDEGRLIVRSGLQQVSFVYRMPTGGTPVVADTDGDGRDTVSLAWGGHLYIMDGLGKGPAELVGPDPLPIALPAETEALVGGDFDGDGVDEIAALHDGRVTLVSPGGPTTLGYVGDALPVAGDWDGDGVETIAAYDVWRAQFHLYGRDGDPQPVTLSYGATGMLPVAGEFGDLPGTDNPPVHRAGIPPLASGDSGPEVALLQTELARVHLYRGPIDGDFGPETAYAVLTLHKVLGVTRSYEWEEEDSLRMAWFTLPPLPDRPDEPNRIEVDVGRQVLYLFEGGVVTQIIPVSTAGGYVYYSIRQGGYVGAGTPHGDFHLIRHSRGWGCDPVTGWCIYNPWSFTPYYALHGYRSVPAYPASHGCVRIPLWESDWLESHLYIGMPIHIWDTYVAPRA
jgi:N-acetylmuramoyl-L-alanine amidase